MGALTRAALAAALILACGSRVVSAQPIEAASDDEAAHASFRAGVEAAEREDWDAAAAHFAASIERAPRTAAVYNLVIAYGHLGRWPELAYAVDRLRRIADPERHATVLREADRLRERALQHVAAIELSAVPPGARVSVGDHIVPGAADVRTLYLAPGQHRIRLDTAGGEPRELELTARAGTHAEVAASAAQPAALPPNPYPTRASPAMDAHENRLGNERGLPSREHEIQTSNEPGLPSRSREGSGEGTPNRSRPDATALIAASLWAAGAAAWLSGLIVVGVTASDADQLADADPTISGFLSHARRYRAQRAATMGLAITGGLLASAATLLWPWTAGQEDEAWWIALTGVALMGAGAALLIRSPDRLGATRLTDPARALASLLISSGAPLVLAPLGAWLGETSGAPAIATGFGIAGTF